MSISSGSSRMANLHLQKVERLEGCQHFGSDYEATIERWLDREDSAAPRPELLRDEAVAYFCIETDGRSFDHWPDDEVCDMSESLFREFSEDDRLWEIEDARPRCVRITYQVLNEQETLVQLLLPYFSADALKGFVVVSERD